MITVNNNYFFVAAVKNIHKDGIAPLEEVAAMIQNKIYIDKRNEKKTAEIAAQTAGLSLEQIAATSLHFTVRWMLVPSFLHSPLIT